MLRLLLVRHGETDWNKDRRIMGRENTPLNETGREQSRHFKESLGSAPLDGIYTSPVNRAVQTTEILSQERDLEVIQDDRLIEVGYGDWVGKTFEEVRQESNYIPYYERLDTPVAPGGETLYEVRDRARDFVRDLQEKHPDYTAMVVTHADWIKCLLMHVLEIPLKNIWRFRIDNASVSLLECEGRARRVICINHRGDMERLFLSRFWF